MEKRNLRKLALLGLASGLVIGGSATADETPKNSYVDQLLAAHKCKGSHGCPGMTANRDRPRSENNDMNEGNLNYHLMTEDELMLELNQKGRELYQKLDANGKRLARVVASQMCNETNECAGLNGCQTEHNSCAGQGSCKGKSKCAIADKNLAVKLVSDKLAKKRRETALKKR